MSKIHQGKVGPISEFDKVWESLKANGELSLKTVKKKKPFIAKATVVGRGQHSDERAILFFQETNRMRRESARAYKCCWGHHTNCYGKNGTRIGMYCEALSNKF